MPRAEYDVAMSAITSEQARSYLDRWKLVREIELGELRHSSLETKVQQLAVLMASRDFFRSDDTRERDVQAVRERWAHIRKALRG